MARKCKHEKIQAYKHLKANNQVVGGYDAKNVVVLGRKMSKPEKKKLFAALAEQLGYDIS